MGKIVKIVLDTAEFHPLHNAWKKLAQKLAEELGVELEIKKEDYMYAINHGLTDDLGMAALPQLFAELEDGTVKLVLGQYPFDPKTTKPDEEQAYQQAKKAIEEILRDP
ncbi:MAG: hypothetical protein GSR77_01515 [Desulfurococcales archaeon]|nr:hypothetical protein [Desulfurococcales archaeon]